jgi:hypothetical protein
MRRGGIAFDVLTEAARGDLRGRVPVVCLDPGI